ncbi:hypothetical protein SEA_NOVASHARKS_79 [Gordonia phage NovaSharks]|uniref:Uncharacterized protein n=1 Tax=Gordonia phage NovaSharks TaxID=2927258 RepID=A0A9E7TN49_9CAUD|nr:hypothetical protein SEA_NOVASHARKS_79 [Gordonia phage NovaSharks]
MSWIGFIQTLIIMLFSYMLIFALIKEIKK